MGMVNIIDYKKTRNNYRPRNITTLLVGEAPPPNGKTFFYIPRLISLSKKIEDDASLPATIFNHYFGKRPESIFEYEEFLKRLQNMGVYLLDIIDEPIRIRGNKINEGYLIKQIPFLNSKIKSEHVSAPESNWIFLLARTSYQKHLRAHYPLAKRIRWKDFRLTTCITEKI